MLIVAFFMIHAFFFLLYLFFKLKNKFKCPRWRGSSGSDDDGVPLVLYSVSHVNYYRYVLGQRAMRKNHRQNVLGQQSQRQQRALPSSGPSTSPTQENLAKKSFPDLEAQPLPSSSTASTSRDIREPRTSTRSFAKFIAEKGKAGLNKNGKLGTEKKVGSNSQRDSKEQKAASNSKAAVDTKTKVEAGKKKVSTDTRAKVGSNGTKKPPATTTQALPTLPSKGKFGPNTKPKGGAKRTPQVQNIETNVSQTEVEKTQQDTDVPDTQALPKSRHGLHRQSTTSVEPLTSTESAAITTEADLHILSESSDRRQRKKSLFSSLDSVKSLTDDGVDLPLHYSGIGKKKPHYYIGISDVIDPRIRSDISNAVPVCSREVKAKPKKREGVPSVHWSNHVELRRQKSLPDDIRGTPPSPAPATPVKPRERSFHKEASRSRERPKVHEEKKTEWSYEEYKKQNKEIHATFAPRLVVIRQPADYRDEKYLLNEQTAEPSYTYKQSFIGAASPTRPIHSYVNPEYIAVGANFNQSKSFVRNIYEQYHSNDRHNTRQTSTAMMNPLEDRERKIIIEFCHLLEKSKQLFNGLRELPQYGHKQWSLYFGRTFDIYTRLWKFQQLHRAVLDSKYGMKRWQIGEIASKIGQLYYHFYLRTSETAYLNEAFSFYYAIRGRCYYTKANKEDKCELMVKKLRYYARFIVVCLLLNKMKLVKELIKELERQIIEYGNTYDPDDQVEWTVVVDEVKAFIHAEPVVSVVNTDNQTMILSHRLSPLITPPVERSSQMNLSLQEIVIVGSSSQQVKFSELTMDMFRMLQTLEREPSGDVQHIFDESPRSRFMTPPNPQSQEGVEGSSKMPNPHKYLLFKPSPTQMLVYLASASNDLPPNGALLLYISADGYVSQNGKHAEEATWGYDLGGLITTSKNDIYRECSKDPKSSTSSKYKELQCFYPGDLYPFTRRPLFLIVDSDNSYAFQNIPRHFGQPLVILMSPLDMPPSYHDPRRQGSLFTLFLHSPLEGLCYCCDLSSVALSIWDRAQMLLDTFMAEASSILTRSRIDPTYISFMGDDFFRLLLVRFVFCEAVLRLHRLFRGRTHHTRCSPVLPDELFEHPTLVHIILDIASVLQIRNHIHDPSGANNAAMGPPN